MEKNLVSVIINSYNGEKFVQKSLNSVLNQSYKNLEVIFWDNASTDNTKDIINLSNSDKRIKYTYSNKFQKLYAAKNEAVKLASGSYLAFLDVDDWWDKDKLSKQITLMEKENYNISCTNYYLFNEKKNITKKIFKKSFDTRDSFNLALKNYFVGMSTLIIKKDLYDKLSYGFNKSYEVIGDYDLVLRILKNSNILYIKEPLSYYRWHHSNLSNRKFRLNILELIKWKKNLQKIDNFFSSENLLFLNNHILFLKALYLKKNKTNKYIYMLMKNSTLFYTKIKIILILFLPKFLLKLIRS